jgi:hypothetical protein
VVRRGAAGTDRSGTDWYKRQEPFPPATLGAVAIGAVWRARTRLVSNGTERQERNGPASSGTNGQEPMGTVRQVRRGIVGSGSIGIGMERNPVVVRARYH